MIGDQGCDLVPPVGIEPTTHGLGRRVRSTVGRFVDLRV